MPHPSFPRLRHSLLVAVALVAALPASAAAQDFGLRAGVSVDPDQFYFGLHVQTDPLIDRLRFTPNIELGVGDDLVLVALNFEFTYGIPVNNQPWNIYVGAGPAVNLYSYDDDRGDDSDVEGGFNILFGVAHRGGLFVEFKVGALDSPELKFGVGYTFR
jgi:hypothetical protein